jgi:YD repeat-containing protein
MKLTICVLTFCVLLTGCFFTGGNIVNYYYDKDGQYVEITDPQAQCVLYRVVGENAQLYAKGLFVANYSALKAGLYTPKEAFEAINELDNEIDRPGATVGSVINTLFLIAARASKVGAPELILITEGLGDFKADMTPLDDCTIYKLKKEIGSQRTLIMAFK